MSGDRAIRFLAAAVVLAVAAFAAIVSYSHIYRLGTGHGQSGTAARLLPLSVDGLILASGLVLLHAARSGRQAPVLGRFCLWLGIGATIGANIAYGARYGVLGAVISAWPAVAFIGSAEMALGMIRSARSAPVPAEVRVPGGVPEPPAALNGHGHAAAQLFAADVEAGRVPGIRAIRSGLHVGQDKAQLAQDYLRALTESRRTQP